MQSSQQPDEARLTPTEVGTRLGFSYTKVLSLIAAGEFPNARNIGGQGNGRRYEVPLSDVDNWRDSRKVTAA